MTTSKQAGNILPFSFDNIPVRGRAICLNKLQQFIPAIKNNEPFTQGLIKECLAAVILFQDDLKADQSVTLQLVASGTISLVIAQALPDGTIKAYANVDDSNTIDNFEDFIKTKPKMVMTVENKGKSYQSIIPVETTSLTEALIAYYKQSVQNKTHIKYISNEDTTYALMLQHLPTDAVADDDWVRLGAMADTLTIKEAAELSHNDIIARLFAEDELRAYDEKSLEFYTTTDKARMRNALKSLGILQCKSLLEDGDIEMTDQFSGLVETFKHEDIQEIFEEVRDNLRKLKAQEDKKGN